MVQGRHRDGGLLVAGLASLGHRAGDLILLLVAFDGTVILQAEDFAPFSRYLPAAGDLRALYLLFIVITFALWALAVFGIERRMQATHTNHRFSMSHALTMAS